jgi:DNA-binding NarL/FixJ family response regulator
MAAFRVRLAVWIRTRPWARIRAVGKTVLIVDDHPSFRASARRMLEADGYEVVGEAADGISAIDAARELKPDVVLLDIRLPDIEGFQVAERLLRNGATPAIVLTSSRDRSDFGHDIDVSPAHGFIPKSELSAEAITLMIR